MAGYDLTMRLWRGDADGGDFAEFSVPVSEGEVVLDAIHRIQATQAPDLAVRWNCKAGKCGSCSAEINGKPRLMCMTRLNMFEPEETITVNPMRTFPVIRDLVTDVSFNYEMAKRVPAFAPGPRNADGTYRMDQRDVERSQEFRKCIECFLCQNVCHVIRDHEGNKQHFAGPRFFARYAELEMHPLDTHDRRDLLREEMGLGLCNITKCCTEVCPEHIKITDNAIIPLKERVVDRRYDPLVWLGSKIFRRGAGPGDDLPPHTDDGPAPPEAYYYFEETTFPSGDGSCAAWSYRPTGVGPFPAVVMAHGFAGVREGSLEPYAEQFALAGYAVLVFDYRGWGGSSGEPRQVVDPKEQLADWAAAVRAARGLPHVDPNRVALWGTSYSGGHVIATAAEDPRIAAVIAQAPHTSGVADAREVPLRGAARLLRVGLRDRARAARGGDPLYIPVVGPPGSLAVLTSPDAEPGYRRIMPGTWRNEVAARSVLAGLAYHPGRRAGDVRCPLLVQVMTDDVVTPAKAAVRAVRRAPRGTLRRYRGGHFDAYGAHEVLADQLLFLAEHVPVTATVG